MAKDYAERRNGGGRQTRNKSAMPGWVWLFVGLSLGLAIAAGVYITRPVQQAETLSAEKENGKTPAPGKRKPVPVPPKEPSRFSFYEMLPSYEVVIPRKSDQNDKASPPIAEPGQYIIQVGSFRSHDEAEQQKAKLALLGVESRIEKVTIDNKDTWYRVRIGPEKDIGRVHTIMTRLEENGIKPFLVRIQG